MSNTSRRAFLGTAAATLAAYAANNPRAAFAADAPAKPRQRANILYGLSTGSWGRVVERGNPLPLLKVLDETAAAGFNGVRLTGFPSMLEQAGISVEHYGNELARRGLKFSTVSFGGQYHDRDQQAEIRVRARAALAAHHQFGATAMVFFPPGAVEGAKENELLDASFRFLNELGKMAVEEYGVRMGLHNHTDSLIENQQQVDRFLEGTDPRWVYCAWDSAHLHLGGCDVQSTYKKSIDRLVYTDFKDATRTPVTTDYLSPNGERFAGDSKSGRFFNSMLELGRGEIDFVALMQMLKAQNFKGWINHDLDTIRVSIADSWRVSMDYITEKLDPIYQ